MKYIQGENRNQLVIFPVSLDQSISDDNEVRLIDLFVDSLPLDKFGFKMDYQENGRPGYHPAGLLKLFIYGYLNKTRSSRDLEKEAYRNIEVMWLLKRLQPDHNTISNFRRDNKSAIKKVFRQTVAIAKHFNLIGGKLIAGDSSKFRAQNSKKNNYNQKKIDRHIQYIDNKLDEYNKELDQNDEDNSKRDLLKKEINTHLERKEKYNQIEKLLHDTGQEQISTSDPESRQMITRNNITEVAYNVQTSVDEKNNILIDYKVTNNNDSKAMGNMLRRAKSILRDNSFTALYDKGYHTGSEFKTANDLGVEVLVAIPALPSSSQAPCPDYNVEKFCYNKHDDTYTCPQGQILNSNGKFYSDKNARFKQYRTKACKDCTVKHLCSKSKNNKRIIQRSQYAQYVEKNKENFDKFKDIYRKRQAIVEHPYGTIKRQWGFSYVLTKKGKDRADSEMGLIFTAYNIRRIFNILGKELFRKYIEAICIQLYHVFIKIEAVFSPFLNHKIILAIYKSENNLSYFQCY